MTSLFRTVRTLLALLPGGSRRFVVTFAVASGALAILDVAALGLLAMTLAPMISGSEITLPVLGTFSESGDFLPLLVAVGVLIVLKSVFAVTLQWFATRRFARFEQDLGRQLLDAFFVSPWTDRLGRNSTDLVRSTDVGVATTVSGVLIPFAMLSGEVFTFVAVMLVLVVAQPLMAVVTVVYFGIVGAFLYGWVLRKAVAAGTDNREYSARAVRLVSEMVASLKEITLRDKGGEVSNLVQGVRRHSSQARANMSFLGVVPRYVLEASLVGGFALAAVVGSLGGDGLDGALTSLALFGVAGFRIVPSITRFQSIMAQTAASIPFAEKVIAEIARGQRYAQKRHEAGAGTALPDDAQEMIFDAVSFRYPGSDRDAVDRVDVRIPFGSSIALVGASGSGKSTLVDMILGLLEPTAGEIRVDDQPLAGVLASWRSRVGYVPQEVSLFDASVAQNVALSWTEDGIDRDRVRRALERAQVLDIVEAREGGIDAPIGERGMNLSGGQRQRLGIARALYAEPMVLIMDEATSALDTGTEALVTQAIQELRGDVTVIVVAHRLATIRHSDAVCFMRDGEMVVSGTFAEVVAAEPDFAHQAALAGLANEPVERNPDA
ncbi:ABC-type bacteriocin/lantibiotic exporter with N-terminal double-glycine peptidase domain [Sanguibacter keddieii DSM 10542]|uniref:ABC-type bacteriocin/lantibiotic exporter with N-terminal double-glycine peptidase domain n=1 Tax=Sanguibacter keddieii (strain ATCC 51767 / DSM 10542 / NCFB 3025 / ST-74) TaxID=446469 RepID=D1BC36_SANKS|nr:ABC transporter ATP-binding protein [Sanguibacter keddieii]ACZ20816.1 ABC-type bacteriocin/lantibiotic exporter with N-terminal double-glycine peptidase domain [Sanguibacter keddieii DSM 10542]